MKPDEFIEININCEGCGKMILYKYSMCHASALDAARDCCGCMGLPTEPPTCNAECFELMVERWNDQSDLKNIKDKVKTACEEK